MQYGAQVRKKDSYQVTLTKKKIFRGTWIVKDHPEFEWKLGGVQSFLWKIDETSDIEPQEGYGRPKTVRTEENNEAVQEIIPRQEGQHKKPVLFVPDCPS